MTFETVYNRDSHIFLSDDFVKAYFFDIAKPNLMNQLASLVPVTLRETGVVKNPNTKMCQNVVKFIAKNNLHPNHYTISVDKSKLDSNAIHDSLKQLVESSNDYDLNQINPLGKLIVANKSKFDNYFGKAIVVDIKEFRKFIEQNATNIIY